MQIGERVGCGPLPSSDQAMTALISPAHSVFRKAACSSTNRRTMVAQLTRLRRAIAVQKRLTNTSFILSLYLQHFLRRLQDEQGMDAWEDIQQVSTFLPTIFEEQAEAAGKAMAIF